MNKTENKHTEGRPKNLPSKECLECKLFHAFMTCFGLTFADLR